MNDFSMESILFKNIVPSNNISNIKTSKSIDDCVYDAYKSEEELKFYETYTMINDYNTKQKLRMLNKLRNTTNRIHNTNINNSCESYIRSIEETTDTDNNTTQKVEKKKNIFLRFIDWIIERLKQFGRFLRRCWNRFITWVKNKFKKNKDDDKGFVSSPKLLSGPNSTTSSNSKSEPEEDATVYEAEEPIEMGPPPQSEPPKSAPKGTPLKPRATSDGPNDRATLTDLAENLMDIAESVGFKGKLPTLENFTGEVGKKIRGLCTTYRIDMQKFSREIVRDKYSNNSKLVNDSYGKVPIGPNGYSSNRDFKDNSERRRAYNKSINIQAQGLILDERTIHELDKIITEKSSDKDDLETAIKFFTKQGQVRTINIPARGIPEKQLEDRLEHIKRLIDKDINFFEKIFNNVVKDLEYAEKELDAAMKEIKKAMIGLGTYSDKPMDKMRDGYSKVMGKGDSGMNIVDAVIDELKEYTSKISKLKIIGDKHSTKIMSYVIKIGSWAAML